VTFGRSGVGAAVFYAVLHFTLPALDCAGIPESRIAFVWVETRSDQGAWTRQWRLGVRGDSLMNGKQITFGIPSDFPQWYRLAPIDSAGNEPCGAGNAVRVPPLP
jgi:hypothetical protein